MIGIKRGDDMEYVEIDGHKLHLFRAGDEKNPKLVFMSGSGTISPVYDFKILYKKLVRDFRIIVIEKFGYGCSDLYEGPCDIDSVVAYQREALEKAGENGPFILLPHSMSKGRGKRPFHSSSAFHVRSGSNPVETKISGRGHRDHRP